MSVRFLLDDEIIELKDVDPTETVLDYLRYRLARTGTKEGCAEGDCGACTILLGALDASEQAIVWRAVNACILFLPMLNGKALMTVESLTKDGQLNPLQACMAANGSSQCGFCTPGFVMSLHGRSIGARGCELPAADVLAGNLCRCTGYGPILAAADAVGRSTLDESRTLARLRVLASSEPVSGAFGARKWYVPLTTAELADLLTEHPDARIVAGATDVGLWVTKGLKTLEKLIFIGDILELHTIEESDLGIRIGAGVRWADLHEPFSHLHPDLGELVRRFAGLQVRNSGTIGGNIANGSPIGDGPPALIAVGAELTLRSASSQRTIPLESFFIEYRKQDLQAGEFVESIWIPRPNPEDVIHISKLSRRFDSDISAVCGAFRLTVRDGLIVGARVVFGGMAATPRRAPACEAALIGAPFTEQTMQGAARALQADYSPLSDVRGSADYRLVAAGNLLLRLWYRAQGDAISVLEADAAHV